VKSSPTLFSPPVSYRYATNRNTWFRYRTVRVLEHRNRRHTQKNTAKKKKKKKKKKVSFLSSYRFLFLTTVLEYSSTSFFRKDRLRNILHTGSYWRDTSPTSSLGTRHNKKRALGFRVPWVGLRYVRSESWARDYSRVPSHDTTDVSHRSSLGNREYFIHRGEGWFVRSLYAFLHLSIHPSMRL